MGKRIRSVEMVDVPALRDIYAPFVSDSATSFEMVPPDVPEFEQRIKDLQGRYPWLVFEVDHEIVGFAYASPHRSRKAYQWSVEVSVYVRPNFHRRGIGRALYSALLALLRRQGYFNAYAGITLPNPASVGLHEAIGFTSVGVFERVGFKFGRWHDVVWLQMRLLDDPLPAGDPLPADIVLADESLNAVLDDCAQGASSD